jgi:hypothetical protein
MKELFQYTRYYYRTNPIIAPIIDKLAEYPITNFTVETKSSDFNSRITSYVNSELQLREFMIGMGQDWGVFGNSFVSLIYPFHRHLICERCTKQQNIENTNRWKYTGTHWLVWCKDCKMEVRAKIKDVWIRDPNKIRLHRWPVQQIDIQYNTFTGESKYFYRISPKERKAIESGLKFHVAKTPQVFLEAVRDRKDVELKPGNLFHFKRTSIADDTREWGAPIMYPALKEAFHWQTLRKGNEAIAFQYIVPLTILFPQPHGESNPFTHLKLSDWQNFVRRQLSRWKKDPNHIPIMPIPLGSQQIFGNARAMMVTPELKQTEESIIAACQVPREFVQGGLSWQGSSVSLRMLENHFLVYREQASRFLKWVSKRLHTYLQWPKFEIKMSDFKMADDIQQKQFMLQLMEMKKVSSRHMLEDAGLDMELEYKRIIDEIRRDADVAKEQQVGAAEAQGEAMKLQMKYQAEAQMEAQQHMASLQQRAMQEGERMNLSDEISRMPDVQMAQFDPVLWASQTLDMLKMSPAESRMTLIEQVQNSMPELIPIMNEVASARRGFPSQQQALPEQRAPNRGPDKAVI